MGDAEERGRRQTGGGLQEGFLLSSGEVAGADQVQHCRKINSDRCVSKVLEKQNWKAQISSHYNEKQRRSNNLHQSSKRGK